VCLCVCVCVFRPIFFVDTSNAFANIAFVPQPTRDMGLAHDNNFDTGAHYRDWSPNIGYNAPWSLSSFAHIRAGDHFCLVVRFLLGSRLGKRKTSYKLFNFGALEASSQSADGQSCCTNVSSHSFLQHKFAAAAARNDSTQTTRTASTPGLCPRSLSGFQRARLRFGAHCRSR
jgi:hypothetical protein